MNNTSVLELAPTVTSTTPLPAINLVPGEVAVQRALRRMQVGLVLAVLAAVATVGGLDVLLAGSQQAANRDLTVGQQRSARLQAEAAGYASVTATYREVDTARNTLRTALGQEVRFSRFLAELSATVPASIQIENMTITQGAASPGAVTPSGTVAAGPAAPASPGGTAGTASPAGPAGTPTAAASALGTLTVTGKAGSHDDVAAWLDAIGKQRGVRDAYFSTSSRPDGGAGYVTFTSTAVLTSQLLSGRYAGDDGGLP